MANKWAIDTKKYLIENYEHTEVSIREATHREVSRSYYYEGIVYKTEIVENHAQAEEEALWMQKRPPVKTFGRWNRMQLERLQHSTSATPMWNTDNNQPTKKWVKITESYLVEDMLHTNSSYREFEKGDKNESSYLSGVRNEKEIMGSLAQAKEEVEWINSQPPRLTNGNWNRTQIAEQQREIERAKENKHLLARGFFEFPFRVMWVMIKFTFKAFIWVILLPLTLLGLAFGISFIELLKPDKRK